MEILIALGAAALFAVVWYTRRARDAAQRARFRTDFAAAIAKIEPGMSPVGPAQEVLEIFTDAPSAVRPLARPLRRELHALQQALQRSTTWGSEYLDPDQQHQAVRDALLALVHKWTASQEDRPRPAAPPLQNAKRSAN